MHSGQNGVICAKTHENLFKRVEDVVTWAVRRRAPIWATLKLKECYIGANITTCRFTTTKLCVSTTSLIATLCFVSKK